MIQIARITLITQILAGIALLATIMLGLLPALLAGLLIYQLVEFGSRKLQELGLGLLLGRMIVLFFVALIVIAAFTFFLREVASQITEGPESLVALLQRMADVVDAGRSYLPLWTQQYLPANIEEWQLKAADWLRSNATHLSVLGREAGVFIMHILIGMVIGGMIALNPSFQRGVHGPFSQAIRERLVFLGSAFRRIVFSQIRISALNTVLTGIFLAIIMPMLGSPLPLTKTMIAVTFVAGLLPIIGNLISNTVIVLISLSVSPVAAVGSLVFLVVIHKLEYFVNARIIGSQLRARAWEILLSMVIMESVFGLSGIVAGPIYYAYLKDELAAKKMI